MKRRNKIILSIGLITLTTIGLIAFTGRGNCDYEKCHYASGKHQNCEENAKAENGTTNNSSTKTDLQSK